MIVLLCRLYLSVGIHYDFRQRLYANAVCACITVAIMQTIVIKNCLFICLTFTVMDEVASALKADGCPSERERFIVGSFRHYLHQYPCT